MSYLTTQYPVQENLRRVFFSMMSICYTDDWVAKTFAMPDSGLDDEHASFPLSMLIPNDNALDLPFHERVLYLFISHFF